MPDAGEMVEQRDLAALECLDQERPAEIVQAAVGFRTERLLERQAPREARVDLIGIHMFAENHADARDPVEFADGPAHVIGHQEREVRRAPVGRQPELDMDAVVRIHIGSRDEIQFRHGFVELRIGHAPQAVPHFCLPIPGPPDGECSIADTRVTAGPPASRFTRTTVHGAHRGAWTASAR